ncbi:hypothetical protein [Nocardia sp. NPDC003979]
MTSQPEQSASTPPPPPATRWADLPTPADLKRWEAIRPGTVDRILTAVEQAERHDQRIRWAELGLRAFGTISGLTTVAIMALTAKHFVDHGAPLEGAGIIGAGSVSIVTAFITLGRRNK